MKLVTSDKKYLNYIMKPNFTDGFPFSKHIICCRNWKKRDYDEQTSVPLTGNIGHK